MLHAAHGSSVAAGSSVVWPRAVHRVAGWPAHRTAHAHPRMRAGVVGGAPNVSKLLDRGGVEYVQRTGGGFKRTINLLTPNTEEGLRKFEEEIQQIHQARAGS